MTVIGIDIGGANLKFSDGAQQHYTRSFELWRQPERLAAELAEGLAEFRRVDALAITMTGELCDCFETRAEGVARITAAVESLPEALGPSSFYQVGGGFVASSRAVSEWPKTAAANWDAITRWAAAVFSKDSGIVLDIGSTTTDLIPFRCGEVTARGRTDFERLRAGELVYCGATRTPLGSILPEVVWDSVPLGLAAEWFASLKDVMLLCGELEERPADTETCDGRPLTRAHSLRRLARMLCTEPEEAGEPLIVELARAIKQALLDRLARAWLAQTALGQFVGNDGLVILSGSGEWLGRLLLRHVGWNGRVVAWSELYSPPASDAAAASAVARLRRASLGQ
jgi:(4-(4-[2-(gamma-L-glutamylamino)ethyl]phenoxymethyl)furan-2-yl)methanamine synthase